MFPGANLHNIQGYLGLQVDLDLIKTHTIKKKKPRKPKRKVVNVLDKH